MLVLDEIDQFNFFVLALNPQQTKTILEVSIREITVESLTKIIGLPVPDTNWKSGCH